jgi:hypothetical protein
MKDRWRIRVGSYRVLYAIDDGKRNVDITRIAHPQGRVRMMPSGLGLHNFVPVATPDRRTCLLR